MRRTHPSSRPALALATLSLLAACSTQPPAAPLPASATPVEDVAPAEEVVQPPPPWPEAGAPLTVPTLQLPEGWVPRRVFVDPGHGVGQNHGNRSARCEAEAEVMMAIGSVTASILQETGAFEVMLSRQDGEQVSYTDRMQRARLWRAEVFVSLHSDARSPYTQDASGCNVNNDDPGFSVLYSDEGPMAASRQALASGIAAQLAAAGFLPYPGRDYDGSYDGADGVFVDRHPPQQRIMFLRRPAMPSVIIETHHALDVRAVARWREPETARVFGHALAAGLIGWLQDRPVSNPG